MDKQIDRLAQILWDYHQLKEKPRPSDAIFVLCSIDTRVADRAVELYRQGFGKWIIFSGGDAHNDDLLETAWEGSEAGYFADIAIRAGVPEEKILIENKAQNTGENITLTYELLRRKRMLPKSFVLVQKPYMERRTHATFTKQWPLQNTTFTVTSPQLHYDDYFNKQNPKDTIINIIVGDIQRIREYAKRGFQTDQHIPDHVWRAYEQLCSLGFTRHLITD